MSSKHLKVVKPEFKNGGFIIYRGIDLGKDNRNSSSVCEDGDSCSECCDYIYNIDIYTLEKISLFRLFLNLPYISYRSGDVEETTEYGAKYKHNIGVRSKYCLDALISKFGEFYLEQGFKIVSDYSCDYGEDINRWVVSVDIPSFSYKVLDGRVNGTTKVGKNCKSLALTEYIDKLKDYSVII